MTQPLIIHRIQSRPPLIKVRDVLLAIFCWGLWASVMVSIVNGDGFHLSATYLSLVVLLAVTIFLWSLVHYLINPIRSKMADKPVSITKMARHFNVRSELVGGMMQEKQVLVVLSSNGSVTQLAGLHQRWRRVSNALPKSLPSYQSE